MTGRITARFDELRAAGRAGLVAYVVAGDPNYDTGVAVLKALPAAGADVIELGMPFSDPMADGPAIQASGLRALKAGMTLARTLEMVRTWRTEDTATPLVLMGYYNPIYSYGAERFLADAKEAGVDGLIIVDLPPEEDDELCLPAQAAGLDFIRLATPTTDDARLPTVLNHASGFLYYVAVAGITGTKSAKAEETAAAVKRLRAQTDLPITVGFGIRTADDARAVAQHADGVAVGTALVETVAAQGTDAVAPLSAQVATLADAVRSARAGL